MVWARGGKNELKEKKKIFNVNLDGRTCDCKGWQINGVACKHTIAYIRANRLEVSDYIHESISKTMYHKTYSSIFHLAPNQDLWLEVGYDVILPPQVKSEHDRPKLSRRKPTNEDFFFDKSTNEDLIS